MKPNDRTKEFQASVESILTRKNNLEKQRLLNNQYSSQPQSKSEFTYLAANIGKDINIILAKLQRLTQLAKRRTLFDDNLTEINDLIQIVKQDIGKTKGKIDGLDRYSKSKDSKESTQNNKQAKEHTKNVIVSLQSKLATTSNDFKNVLEVRTQNMREQKSRRDQYGTSSLDTKLFNNFASPSLSSHSQLPLYQTSSPRISSNITLGLNQNSNITTSPKTTTTPTLNSINNTISNSNSYINSNINTNSTNININSNNNNIYNNGMDSNSAINTKASTVAPNLLPPLASMMNTSTGTGLSNNYTNLNNNLNNRSGSGSGSDDNSKFVSIDMQNSSALEPLNASLGLSGIIGGGDDSSNGSQQQQQQLLISPIHTDYLESRSQAIDSIESTIAELGQIYQHFAQILAGQRETVQRIDDNIADVEMNVAGAQTQLMKYYTNISNNRWLILKVLGIMMIFFLIFVMFL